MTKKALHTNLSLKNWGVLFKINIYMNNKRLGFRLAATVKQDKLLRISLTLARKEQWRTHLAALVCAVWSFLRCTWAALDQTTGQNSGCDRTSDRTMSFITEGGTYAQKIIRMEIMWLVWSDQDSKPSNLTPSNLVSVTCSTDFPSMVRLRAGVAAGTFLLPKTIHLVLAVFSTKCFFLTQSVMVCNSSCRFSQLS